MKRRTARWSTGMAAAALLVLPAAGWTQSYPAAQQPPASSAPAAERNTQQAGSAQDHLREAKQALNEIQTSSVTGTARAKIVELKRHMNALERFAAANDNASPTGSAQSSPKAGSARSNANWGTEVAAIDRILTELLGPASTTGAASSTGVEPSATAGTTGTTGTNAPATAAQSSKAAALDETTRSKLMEVRTHITAFAAAMSGAGSQPPSQEPTSAASSTDPASAAAGAAGAVGSTASQPPTSTSNPVETQTPSQAQAPQGQTPSQTQEPSSAATAQNPTAQPDTAAPQQAQAQPDPAAAKRHLTEAREALSQLTQLPAAAQLAGDARTQVSQLIANFNQLITTESGDWHPAYEKVSANVAALLGPQSSDETAAPATGTPGAVGTAGTGVMSLDPGIRAKLIEFRTHLIEFEHAAGVR
jgi:hypothetical protein